MSALPPISSRSFEKSKLSSQNSSSLAGPISIGDLPLVLLLEKISYLKPHEALALFNSNKIWREKLVKTPRVADQIKVAYINLGGSYWYWRIGRDENTYDFLKRNGLKIINFNGVPDQLNFLTLCPNLKSLKFELKGGHNLSLISSAKGLESLDIEMDNSPTAEQIEAAGKVLAQLLHLQKVNFFTYDDSGDTHPPEWTTALLKGLEGHTNLREIGFDNLDISHEKADALGDLLEKQKQLKKFSLTYCKFEDEEVGTAVELLLWEPRKLVHLNDLDFSGNDCRGLAFSVACGLKNLPSLRKLNLSSNSFTTSDAAELAKPLGKLRNLTRIDLCQNYIEKSGVKTIVKQLLKNRENLKEKDPAIYFDGFEQGKLSEFEQLFSEDSFSEEAEAVESDEDGSPFVEEDGEPEWNEAEESGSGG